MKYLRYIALAMVFCFFLAAGLWLFAPWETAGRFALDRARLGAARNGMYISYAGFEKSGVIFPTYTVRSLDIDQGMAKFTLSEARVRVLPLSSLLCGGFSCYLSFTDGEGILIPDNRLNLEGGGFKLSLSGSLATVANTRVAGDIEATGRLTFNHREGRVTASTLLLRVSPNMDSLLRNPVFSGKLNEYFESASNGEWRVRQNAAPNS